MNFAEIVIHKVQSKRMAMIFNLFAEGIGKPCKSPHVHSHGQVLAFNIAG